MSDPRESQPARSDSVVRDLGPADPVPYGLVVVSNRLPLRLEADASGDQWRPSAGGLVTALTPVLRRRDGVWIGWSGQTDDAAVPTSYEGIALHAVPITPEISILKAQSHDAVGMDTVQKSLD